MIESYSPAADVVLTPRELVADLIFDFPLELALERDAAAQKVYSALPNGILPPGKIWV